VRIPPHWHLDPPRSIWQDSAGAMPCAKHVRTKLWLAVALLGVGRVPIAS
jgi:hypothetical protein